MTEIGENVRSHTIAIPGTDAGRITIAWAAATDTGKRRAANEDSFIALSPIFAVADGMGGHSSGDRASAAVVERLAEAIDGDFADESAIVHALEDATWDIADLSAGTPSGVGTTATGVVLEMRDSAPAFLVFNIGDSRVYRMIRNELTQVTVDHSVVQELVESGLLTRQEAEAHPESNVITRAVGFMHAPQPDFWSVPLSAGLRMLVCSDGLTKEISDDRIRLHLAAGLTVSETVSALVDAALAAGGRDNVTCVLVEVRSMTDGIADTSVSPVRG